MIITLIRYDKFEWAVLKIGSVSQLIHHCKYINIGEIFQTPRERRTASTELDRYDFSTKFRNRSSIIPEHFPSFVKSVKEIDDKS